MKLYFSLSHFVVIHGHVTSTRPRQGQGTQSFRSYFSSSLVQLYYNSTVGRLAVRLTLQSMAWINPRYIFYFFLLTVCSQTGQCCKKGFAKHEFKAVVPPQVLKGKVVLKVKFNDCSLGEHISLHTNDFNFGIHSNGKVYATHTQNISSTYHFKVLARDLKTHKKWKVPVILVPSADKAKKVLKEEVPVIYFRKASRSRRQKREWIIPPIDVREHEPPMRNPIGSIFSDIEQYGKLTYALSGPGADQPPVNMFVIDPYTGNINITGQVDRELNPEFRLTGQAWNSLGQPVEKPLSLVIKVQDINDNAPVFAKQVFEGSVEELSQSGTFVLALNATDRDEGENAQIAYRILSQGNEMSVTKYNGDIKTTTNNLDRETQDLYTLVVEARDMNGKAGGLYSTANVQIKILDVNDNIPTIEKEEYEASVQENTLNDEVTRIKVFDEDQEFTDNWLGNFEIIEGNEDGHFRFEIDEQTNEGILVLQKELDYEEASTRTLLLRVSNKAAYHSSLLTGGGGGGGSKPVKLKINVMDQKEGFSFKPTKKRITLSENKKKVHIGQKLGRYPAFSADTGKESDRVRYAKGSDPANFFNINPDTSEITLAKLPDRESEHVVNGRYTATVLAIDNDGPVPKTSTGTVVIEVDDENDNIPLIKNLQPCMCDTAKSLTVIAEDLDSYPNAAPFTFKFADAPGVTDKWKILRRDDTSMELQPLKDLWPGTFTVPIKVEDNQGSGDVQNMEVHVVECTGNDLSCSEKSPFIGGSGARLGPAAIGLMALGALLLLLVPLLLLFCNFGGLGGAGGAGAFKQIPVESFGTVEHKNIEGGGERDTHMPLLPVGAGSGAAVGAYSSEVDAIKRNMENSLVNSSNITSKEVLNYNNLGNAAMLGCVDIRRGSHHLSNMDPNVNVLLTETAEFGTMSGGNLLGYMDSYINEKVDAYNLEEQTSPAHDTLLVYNYEGEGSLAGSIDSCNFIEDEHQSGDSYLNDLDLKFKTLADICVGKSESQEVTVTADAPIHHEIMKEEQSISSSSAGGLQAMNIIPDATLMRKNYVVTTTINPVVEMVPIAAKQAFDHQNVVVTNHINTIPKRISMIEDPNIAHQNMVVTKMVNGGAGGITDMIIDPSLAHQNLVIAEQFNTSPRGNPAMIFNPSVTHQNTVVTKVVEGGPGSMHGMVNSPAIAQPHAVEKNVILTKSIHRGDSQSMLVGPSYDHIPTIHKNVTLNRSVKSGMGGVQSSNLSNEAVVQKTRVARKSATSPDNTVHTSVTKVTKVARVMQE